MAIPGKALLLLGLAGGGGLLIASKAKATTKKPKTPKPGEPGGAPASTQPGADLTKIPAGTLARITAAIKSNSPAVMRKLADELEKAGYGAQAADLRARAAQIEAEAGAEKAPPPLTEAQVQQILDVVAEGNIATIRELARRLRAAGHPTEAADLEAAADDLEQAAKEATKASSATAPATPATPEVTPIAAKTPGFATAPQFTPSTTTPLAQAAAAAAQKIEQAVQAAAAPAVSTGAYIYTVKQGDFPAKLAKLYAPTGERETSRLLAANKQYKQAGGNFVQFYAGMKLHWPSGWRIPEGASVAAPTPVAATPIMVSTAAEAKPSTVAPTPIVYVVQNGDYPAKLAKKYAPNGERDTAQLLRANPQYKQKAGNFVQFYAGMKLNWPAGWAPPEGATTMSGDSVIAGPPDEESRILAGKLAYSLMNARKGQEDRSLVALFQEREGITNAAGEIDGCYGPPVAIVLADKYDIVPPKPLYWGSKSGGKASVETDKRAWRSAMVLRAKADQPRAEEWVQAGAV